MGKTSTKKTENASVEMQVQTTTSEAETSKEETAQTVEATKEETTSTAKTSKKEKTSSAETSKKEEETEVEVPSQIEALMRLYPHYEEFWVTPQGFVHPAGAPEYVRKGATLYKNKFYNK